jgi:hypothetical protein
VIWCGYQGHTCMCSNLYMTGTAWACLQQHHCNHVGNMWNYDVIMATPPAADKNFHHKYELKDHHSISVHCWPKRRYEVHECIGQHIQEWAVSSNGLMTTWVWGWWKRLEGVVVVRGSSGSSKTSKAAPILLSILSWWLIRIGSLISVHLHKEYTFTNNLPVVRFSHTFYFWQVGFLLSEYSAKSNN